MIIVKYTGGLGNQMFQHALSISLALHFPDENICADLSRYDFSRVHEGFAVDKYFQVVMKTPNEKVLQRISPIKYFIKKLPIGQLKYKVPISKLDKIEEKLEKNQKIGIITDYKSTLFNHDAFNLNYEMLNTWYFKGNWINPLYWKGYEEEVISSFKFREELLSEQDKKIIDEMRKTESVSIHIRRGDYVGKYAFELCDESYYKEALNKLLHIIGEKEISIYVFSESFDINMQFAQGIQKQQCCVISHPDKSGVDLWMMSKCKYNIITNSTFSYWSALLNNNKQKIVIAPLYAYRVKEIYRTLPVPKGWIQIDNLRGKTNENFTHNC